MDNDEIKNLPRLINFRKAFVFFVGLMIGIFLSYNFFVSIITSKASWWFYLIIILSVLLLIFGFSIFKFKDLIKNVRVKRFFSVCNIFTISVIIGVIVCISHCNITMSSYDFNGKGTITASISQIEEYDFGQVWFLEDASILTKDGIVTLSGKCRVYVSNEDINDIVNIGSKVSFPVIVSANKISNSEDLQKLISGYGYEVKVDLDDDQKIEVVSNLVDLRSKIKGYINDILHDNMTKTNSGLAFSMLFGDKGALDEVTGENFSNSGVMHLLAVSGLHVGVISGLMYFIISFITKKMQLSFKLKSIVDLSFVAVFLLLYSYLCGFTPSVVRASIMVMVYLLCKKSGFRYDILTSLSIAGIIILLISPLSLLSIGFQLSFLCIFAIITIVPKLTYLTDSIKIPHWLSSSIFSSFAINLIIFPIMINCFGEASLISIVSNILVIPLFSFVFPITFLLILFVAIMPFMSFILFIPNVLIQILRFVVELFASIPFGVVEIFKVGYICLALIIFVAFIWKYLMCTTKIKTITLSLLSLIAVVCATISALPYTYKYDTIFVEDYYGALNFVCVDNDTKVAWGLPDKKVNSFIYDLKMSKIDNFIIPDFTFAQMSKLLDYSNKNPQTIFYLDIKWENFGHVFKQNGLKVEFYDTKLKIEDTTYNFVKDYQNKLLALWIEKDVNILYLMDNLTGAQNSFVGSSIDIKFDYLITNDSTNSFENYDINAKNVIYLENGIDNNSVVLSNYDKMEIRLQAGE